MLLYCQVRRRRRRRKVYSELTQEEEEGLFAADAVNEEDPARDRATPGGGGVDRVDLMIHTYTHTCTHTHTHTDYIQSVDCFP